MGLVLVAPAPAHHLGRALTDVAHDIRQNNFVFGSNLDSFNKWTAGFYSKPDVHVRLSPGTPVYICGTKGGTTLKGYEAYRRAGHVVVKAEFMAYLPKEAVLLNDERKPETGLGETEAKGYWEVKNLVRLFEPVELSNFRTVASNKPLPKSLMAPMLAWEP